MTLIQSIFLGLLQGLTEFLPISSSGHLALFQNFWQLKNNLSFDIIVHLGSLLAVLLFFKNKIILILKNSYQDFLAKKYINQLSILFFASIPAAIFGLLFKNLINQFFNSLVAISLGFFITSLFLFLASKIQSKKLDQKLNLKNSLLIGLFQAIAIFPGISRSGSTISAAFLQKINKKDAFDFSFILSIPAIFGATILDLGNLSQIPHSQISIYFLGFISAFFSGIFALRLFKKIILKNKLIYFSAYTFLLSLVTILV